MKLIELNRNPDTRQLRQFGLIALIAMPLVGYLWSHMIPESNWPIASIVIVSSTAIGLICGVLGILKPECLKKIFVGLCLLTLPIGVVVGELVLLAIFLFIFAPISLSFRIVGRDALDRRTDPSIDSYWQEKPPARGAETYVRQF